MFQRNVPPTVAKRDFSYGGGHVHRLSSRDSAFSEFKGFGAIVQPHVAAVEQFEVKCVIVGGPRPTCFVTHPRDEVHMTRMLTSWMAKRGVTPAQARGNVARVCEFSREVLAGIRTALGRSFAYTDFLARVDVVCSAVDGDFTMVVNEVEWDAGFSTFAGTGVRLSEVEAAGGLVPGKALRRPEDKADMEANLALLGSMRDALLACLHAYTGGATCPPPGGIPTRCFRTRRGCTGVNPWIEFRVFNAGRGMRMAEASRQYRLAKDGDRDLIGAPYNVQFGDKLRLCEFTRERQTRGRDAARALRYTNFGNTCWLNAVAHLFRAMGMPHALPATTRTFIEGGTRAEARAVTAALGLQFGVQNDAHEAAILIIGQAAQGLRDALGVRVRTVREAQNYRVTNDVVEPVLSLAIEEASIQGILRATQARRTVQAPLADRRVHTETVTILPPAPRLLIIALKRYTAQARKIRDVVEADEVLTLSGSTMYLHAIVVHLGATPRSGHYVAHVRDPAGWMRFDDSIVTRSAGPDSDEVRRDAYILLYSRTRPL